MSLRITDGGMSLDGSGHAARPVEGGWELSWLPGRVLGRDQAISGLTLAEELKAGAVPGDRRWPLVQVLAAELGLTGTDAAALTGGSEHREGACLERATSAAAEVPDSSAEHHQNGPGAEHDFEAEL